MKIRVLLANAVCTAVAVTLFAPFTASAQAASAQAASAQTMPSSMLTLDQCIQKALARNLRIRAGNLQTDIAESQIREVYSALLPQITGGIDFQYFTQLPVTFLPGQFFGKPELALAPATLGYPRSLAFKAEASQMIYNPQLFLGLKAANTGRELAALQARQTREDVIYNVSATYFNLLTIAQQKQLLTANIANAEKLLANIRVMQQNAMAKRTDVERLELLAKSLAAQCENVTVAEAQLLNVLKLLTATPAAEPLAIDTASASLRVPESSQAVPQAQTGSIAAAPAQRTDMKLLELRRDLQTMERDGVYTNFLPTLIAFASYSATGYSAAFDVLNQANDTFYPVSLVGARLALPIFDGGLKFAQIQTKNLELQNTELLLDLQRQSIANDIDNAVRKYNASLASANTQQANMRLAEKVLVELQVQYRESITGISDVLNATNDLTKAQAEYLTAVISTRLAMLDLRKATGRLLEGNE
jgi:outer membrane protein